MLETSLLPLIDHADRLTENLTEDRQLLFQQDNAPIHKARKTMEFMEKNNLRTITWPANSPDLNLIEHLWPRLKRNIFTMWHAKNRSLKKEMRTNDLGTFVQDAWTLNDSVFLELLLDSMPWRVQAVIRARGGHVKY